MTLESVFTPRDFRNVVGLFATGIAVVSTRIGDEIYGMTVNSFTSVSLEPPLILICVDRGGQLLEKLERTDEFCASFLSADQERHSRRFARQDGSEGIEEPIFCPDGPPFVCGALGGVQCVVHQQIEAGDHIIVLARVVALWQSGEGGGPLLYFRGRYQKASF